MQSQAHKFKKTSLQNASKIKKKIWDRANPSQIGNGMYTLSTLGHKGLVGWRAFQRHLGKT